MLSFYLFLHAITRLTGWLAVVVFSFILFMLAHQNNYLFCATVASLPFIPSKPFLSLSLISYFYRFILVFSVHLYGADPPPVFLSSHLIIIIVNFSQHALSAFRTFHNVVFVHGEHHYFCSSQFSCYFCPDFTFVGFRDDFLFIYGKPVRVSWFLLLFVAKVPYNSIQEFTHWERYKKRHLPTDINEIK